MMLRENNIVNDSFTTILTIGGLILFLYGCIGLVNCYKYYTTKPEQMPFVAEKGSSTAVDVTAHLYQLQPSRYRRAASPKDTCPV